MNKRRYACAVIPDFPAAVWISHDPTLANRPLAIAETEKESSPLVVCSAEARQDGIAVVMTVAQAHSRCPDLVIKPRDCKKEAELSGMVLKKLQTLSPFVESDTKGIFFLDASGLRFIYRDEAEFGEKIIATVNTLCFPVRVGIADTKFAAHVAAISSPLSRYTAVPSGSEQEFLTNLRVARLPLSEETRATLRDLGLQKIGQLALFPANEIIERFGAEGALLSQLAAGIDRAFFLPETPVEPLSQTVPFIFSITDSSMLIAHTEQVLAHLLHRLQRSGQACTTFTLICRLEDKSTMPLTITLDRATAAPASFMGQLCLTLERTVLPSPVVEITVTIPEPAPLIMEQTELHRKAGGGGSPAQTLASTLRIQSPMYTPEIHETHLPETAFRLAPVTFPQRVRRRETPEHRQSRPQTFTGQAITGLRLIQPPLVSKVITERGRTLLWTAPQQLRPVARQQGPWKLSGGWWSGAFDRFYYEMQTVDRHCYLVYFDRLMSRWFVQGVFD